MRIAICDDELEFAESLRAMTAECMSAAGVPNEIDVYADGESLLASETAYDLCFLDCQMPGMDGVELGRKLTAATPGVTVVFVTAYTNYLFDSYDVNHLKYILKPVSMPMLEKTIDDFLFTYHEQKPVFVTSDLSIPMSAILYIVASRNCVEVTTENTFYTSRKSITQYAEELNPGAFFRVDRNVIVNFRHLRGHTDNVITMKNGTQFDIARRRKKDFINAYIGYLEHHR